MGLMIDGIIFGIVVVLAAYMLVLILSIISRYLKDKNALKKKMQSVTKQTASLLNPENDNEVYENAAGVVEESMKTFDEITLNIKNNVDDYIKVNQKAEDYYKAQHQGQSSSIDSGNIMSVEYDNW
jgi:predicted Holliday junction resolvase-like endonuclease